jgi:hypothetical protein
MRKTILALTVIFLAPTAVMALTAGREQVGDPQSKAAATGIEQRQIAPGDVAGSGQEGSLGGKVILAKGDKSGSGPGRGGHKGAHKGEHKGGQKHDKS